MATDTAADTSTNGSSAPKKLAKGAAVYYAVKKLIKSAFVVGAVAAVVKVLRGDREGSA